MSRTMVMKTRMKIMTNICEQRTEASHRTNEEVYDNLRNTFM